MPNNPRDNAAALGGAMFDFGPVVRELRGDLTQAEFAARMGFTQTAVSYWEAGKRTPGLDDLAAMLAIAGRDWSSIFGQGTTIGAYRQGYAAGLKAALRAVEKAAASDDQNEPS